jgi:hypothetical protein
VFICTDLAWPDTVTLLDDLSPGRREPWLLDGEVEVDRPTPWRTEIERPEVRLEVRAERGIGPHTTTLIRTLLQHGGTGTTRGSFRVRPDHHGRRWTLATFDQAVRADATGALDLLAGPALDDLVDAVPPGEVLGWGVVANVVRERLVGEDLELRRGLRHFTGGTKLWVSQIWNGDGGDKLWVTGLHRHTRKPIRIIVERRHLENGRAKAVYSTTVLRRLEGVAADLMLHDTQGRSRRWAEQLATPKLEAEVDHPRRWMLVDDPPPLELDIDGTTVYLAHFNHRRARYSALPPPTERLP